MSTRSSIWLGEEGGTSVHIYWELGEREMQDGRSGAVPIYVAVDKGNDEVVRVRLPKEVAEALLTAIVPDNLERFGFKVG